MAAETIASIVCPHQVVIVVSTDKRTRMLHPIHPLPDSLRGNEKGTFTESSVLERLPSIARRTIAENDLGTDCIERVEALADEIGSGVITVLEEPELDDAPLWAEYVKSYVGMRWVDVPWFFAETYFYRRLLSATGYSRPGPRCGVDPFALQKQAALDGGLPIAAPLAEAVGDIRTLLHASLWANRADLSLGPLDKDNVKAQTAAVLNRSDDQLLVDHTEAALQILNQSGARIHLVLDNAGTELIADLALAAAILKRNGSVVIHAKPHPTYVSDVSLPDLEATIACLTADDSPAPELGVHLRQAQQDKRLSGSTDHFWTSCLPFWKLPPHLVDELSGADMAIIKGDANYRRLLGDLHWEASTPLEDIVRPLQPTLALRTAKAEVAAGVAPEAAEQASSADPDWLTNGEWGMIQLAAEID